MPHENEADGSAVRARMTSVERLIRFALRRAGAVLVFERLWPAVLLPTVVVALFLIVSLFGLWLAVPPLVRVALVVLFALAFLASLWPLWRLTPPGSGEARQRVESRSGLVNRPVTALEDVQAAGRHRDPGSEALWEAHRNRAAASITRLTAGPPRPGVAARDPFALRVAVLLLLIVALAWAGPDWQGRIAAAVAPMESYEQEIARIDAWVAPPRYTGRPPLMLTGSDERDISGNVFAVPEGSTLTVRAPGGAPVEVRAGGLPLLPENPEAGSQALAEYGHALDSDGTVAVTMAERPLFEWRFSVIPDEPPSIALTREPDVTQWRALRLSYEVEDDYGVVSAQARIRALEDAQATEDALIPPPDFPLTLPKMRARSGSAQTIKEMASHPWAGSRVRLHLVALDDLGQEGSSDIIEITLPQRQFNDPLARALVEQRRNLAIDREARGHVVLALDALTQAPDTYFDDELGLYLSLRATYWRLRNANSDDTLRSVVRQLWEIALHIEDGGLSLAAEDLRAAQERLMEALEGDAGDEEIERLMAELREALNAFLQELAQRGMDQGDMADMPIDPNVQSLSQGDLDRMLDAIEEMARSGARDAARQMLSELQNMLENLQAGRSMEDQLGQGPLGEALDELGDMIRRQQELMDQTHEFDQHGPQGEDGDQLGELGEGQGALREALEQLMQRLEELGADPGQELGQAGEAMGEAEGSLGEGDTGEALGQQGRALENLRRGGQGLAEALMQQQGQGMADGETGQGRQRTDPFGRPLRSEGPDHGLTVEVPDEIDTQRARRILEELRRRLTETERPRIERDYLERLLERF